MATNSTQLLISLAKYKFNELTNLDSVVYGPNTSINRVDNNITIFGIIARKTGGRYFYSKEVAEKDKLLLCRLVSISNENTHPIVIEYPYKDLDLENMWVCMFDVWVKDWKKYNYAMKFLKLIKHKLLQVKLAENL